MVQNLLAEPDQLSKALEQVIRRRCEMKKRAVEAVFLSMLSTIPKRARKQQRYSES